MSEAGMLMTKGYEGWRDMPYKDTLGNMTIGYGFNMSDPIVKQMLPKDIGKKPLSKDVAEKIFMKRYEQAKKDASTYIGSDIYGSLNEGRQNVLNDMAYNLGLTKLSGFIELKKAILKKNWEKAAKELKNSNWYKQVGNRSKNHYLQIQED